MQKQVKQAKGRRIKLSAASTVLAAIVLGCSTPIASAQDPYTPDVAMFDGTNGIDFPTSDSLMLKDGATIEFWVQCDWDNDPGYDPVIVSNAGPEGALYTVSILGDKSGLNLQAGENIASVDHDFSAEQMHHVAIADFTESTAVMINGSVASVLEFGFADKPSSGFWVASADGQQAPFIGAIAGLRLWDVALDRSDLVKYAIQDVFIASDPHPELDALIAQSDFDNQSLELFTLDNSQDP